MTFVFQTTSQRSELMKKIKGVNTKPEIAFAKKLELYKVKFRKHFKKLPGVPDFAILRGRVAVFIDGEFWHGYNWVNKKKRIRSNRQYWIKKIERNILRDSINMRELKKIGWYPLRFWQHEVVAEGDKCIKKIEKIMQRRSSK